MSGINWSIDTRPLEALIKKMDGDLGDWLRGVAEEIKNDVVTSFNTGPRGRAYPRGNGKVHYASTAGNPPNVDTGALRASIRVIPKSKLRYWVAAGTDYAEGLEFGTTRIRPRPYMRPAFDKWSRGGKLARSLEGWMKL
jgi:hypothetical protein